MAQTKVKVETSTSGRRYVSIDAVIKRRLEEIKKSRTNGNGNGQVSPKDTVVPGTASKSTQGKNPAT